MSQEDLLQSAIRIVSSTRFDLSNEKRLQEQIANAFLSAGIHFLREYHLGDGDIPDFLLHDGVVLECKLHGASKIGVFRQLQRYAKHQIVSSIILVTNLSMGLPNQIEGKPAYFVSLSRAWL